MRCQNSFFRLASVFSMVHVGPAGAAMSDTEHKVKADCILRICVGQNIDTVSRQFAEVLDARGGLISVTCGSGKDAKYFDFPSFINLKCNSNEYTLGTANGITYTTFYIRDRVIWKIEKISRRRLDL